MVVSGAMKTRWALILCLTAFSVTALAQAPPSGLPRLTPLPCEGLKWAPTGEPSSIDFENGTNGPVTLEALTVFRDEPPDSPTPFRASAIRVLAPGHAIREPIRQGQKY